MKNLLIIIVYLPTILLLSSCYEETDFKVDDDITSLKFMMSSDQEESIYNAYDEKLDIEPSPSLIYENKEFEVEDFNLRGESTLRYRKKSFSVETEIPIGVKRTQDSKIYHYMRNVKLISLVSDYTYIEGKLSFELLSKLNIQPLFFNYVEVLLNENTQGLYLLIEDPDEFTFKQGHEFILRRGYNGSISKSWFYQNYTGLAEIDYKRSFNEIYSQLTKLEGEELYNFFAKKLNINNYFRKIALDYIIMNGDYSDELFFIGEYKDSDIYFDIIPWDYDDIFSNLPHEIGRNYGMGNRFGKRTYNTVEDVLNDVGEKLIFSIEDDLDYVIARDTFLYAKYLEQLDTVCHIISNNFVDETFDQIKDELLPYYNVPEIVEQSKYGDQEFSKADFLENLIVKSTFLKNRLTETRKQVMIHKSIYK